MRSTGGEEFNVEIVSIAESEQLHIINKREEFLDTISNEPVIPLSKLKKANNSFPSTETSNLIKKLDHDGAAKNHPVTNPWHGQEKRILLSSFPEPEFGLYNLLSKALASKANKPHAHKDNTYLVIDNRSCAFDIDDFHDASERFNSLKLENPFKEVWFYTGYYSDNDGNNAEWSLAPILAPSQTLEKMAVDFERRGLIPNDLGLVFRDIQT